MIWEFAVARQFSTDLTSSPFPLGASQPLKCFPECHARLSQNLLIWFSWENATEGHRALNAFAPHAIGRAQAETWTKGWDWRHILATGYHSSLTPETSGSALLMSWQLGAWPGCLGFGSARQLLLERTLALSALAMEAGETGTGVAGDQALLNRSARIDTPYDDIDEGAF